MSKNIDLTLLPHSFLTRRWVEEGISESNVATTGMAVAPKFFAPFSAEERRAFMARALDDTWVNGKVQPAGSTEFKLDPDVTTVTIAGGRAGVGDYPTMVKSLIANLGAPLQIVTLTGENKAATTALKALATIPGVTLVIEPWREDDKPLNYIRSSNAYIVKSGGLSSTESAVLGVPTLLLDINRGPESYNSKFFKEMEMAEVVKDQSTVGPVLKNLLADPARLARMKKAQLNLRTSISMSPIEDFVFGPSKTTVAPPAAAGFCRKNLDI